MKSSTVKIDEVLVGSSRASQRPVLSVEQKHRVETCNFVDTFRNSPAHRGGFIYSAGRYDVRHEVGAFKG